MSRYRESAPRLRWQSSLPLFIAVLFASAAIGIRCVAFYRQSPSVILVAFIFGVLLALLTWKLRAATLAASLAGGWFTVVLYLATPGLQTALWPLLALLLLTLGATRFGRARKQQLGIAESPGGRNVAQVAANLGPAVLAAVALILNGLSFLPLAFNAEFMQIALAAALAEAAADTLSSELGEVLGGEPRLLTTFRRVAAGTDGAVSMEGTLAGLVAGGIVAAVASVAFSLSPPEGAAVALAAVAGLFIDSLLGALFERRGWLNNDAVNFLSGIAAGVLAAIFTAGL